MRSHNIATLENESRKIAGEHFKHQLACIVRMSKRPKKSFTEISKSKRVFRRSAEVPEYQGNIGKKEGRAASDGITSFGSEKTSGNFLHCTHIY